MTDTYWKLKGTLEEHNVTEVVKDGLSKAIKGTLNTGETQATPISVDLISSASSLGFGACISFLATIIVKKNRTFYSTVCCKVIWRKNGIAQMVHNIDDDETGQFILE
jgi:hypothetical protein